jgi:hypothetical protein
MGLYLLRSEPKATLPHTAAAAEADEMMSCSMICARVHLPFASKVYSENVRVRVGGHAVVLAADSFFAPPTKN